MDTNPLARKQAGAKKRKRPGTDTAARTKSGPRGSRKKPKLKGPSEKIRSLAAMSLASKVGYLKLSDLLRPEDSKLASFIGKRLRRRTFKRGELIRAPGQKQPALFIVRSGSVNIFRRPSPDRRYSVNKVDAGTIFGEMPSLGQTMLGAEAEAAEESEIIFVKESDFGRMAAISPPIVLKLLDRIGPRLVDAEKRHEQAAFQTIPVRLASLMLTHADESGVVRGLSHQEMADMLGVYRETVTNGISDLKRAGMVKVGRKRITILDKEGLRRIEAL